VRAGEIQLEGVDPRRLQRSTISTQASFRYSSMIEAIRTPVGMGVLALLELVEPDREGPVADELDVLPADDLLAVARGAWRSAA
jgi:hypothetical protein